MAFEEQKVKIKNKLLELEKEEPIFLAFIAIKEKERKAETEEEVYPIIHSYTGIIPNLNAFHLVERKLRLINEAMVKQANEQGWRIRR